MTPKCLHNHQSLHDHCYVEIMKCPKFRAAVFAAEISGRRSSRLVTGYWLLVVGVGVGPVAWVGAGRAAGTLGALGGLGADGLGLGGLLGGAHGVGAALLVGGDLGVGFALAGGQHAFPA